MAIASTYQTADPPTQIHKIPQDITSPSDPTIPIRPYPITKHTLLKYIHDYLVNFPDIRPGDSREATQRRGKENLNSIKYLDAGIFETTDTLHRQTSIENLSSVATNNLHKGTFPPPPKS